MNIASAVLVFLLAHCLLLLHRCMGLEAGGVFDQGRHGVSLTRVDETRAPSWCGRGGAPSSSPPGGGADTRPPKPLLVAAPREDGEYPVLDFLHGYLVVNSFYSQLLQHVASHGFVVVGPQLYTISGADTTEEINAAAAVIGWLAGGGLSSVLPPGVRADLAKVSVSGHSRGGKVAFALALGHAKLAVPLAALVAVDPVDGMGVGKQTPPPVLTGRGLSLRVAAPAMVIGTGLGELPRGPLLPPCAPRGVGHAAFYGELDPAAAACHLVAADYGHTDMMDDDTHGRQGAHAAVRGRRHRRVPEEMGGRGRRCPGQHQGAPGAGARGAVRRRVSRGQGDGGGRVNSSLVGFFFSIRGIVTTEIWHVQDF